jgi:IS30 family transposase
MGCENNNPNEVKKGIHFTLDERFVMEWLWNGKGKAKKERNPAKLAAILGKSRRTIIREIKLGKTTQRRSSDWEYVEYYSAELGQLRQR